MPIGVRLEVKVDKAILPQQMEMETALDLLENTVKEGLKISLSFF